MGHSGKYDSFQTLSGFGYFLSSEKHVCDGVFTRIDNNKRFGYVVFGWKRCVEWGKRRGSGKIALNICMITVENHREREKNNNNNKNSKNKRVNYGVVANKYYCVRQTCKRFSKNRKFYVERMTKKFFWLIGYWRTRKISEALIACLSCTIAVSTLIKYRTRR